MNKRQILTFGAIAFLSASSVPQITAAEAEVKADIDLPKNETRIKHDRDGDVVIRTDREQPRVRHVNKASGLLGMEVRNRENQKLGEIKDLVMSDPSKVSYAVLAVGGVLGIGEKLIALPPSALNVSADGDHLILEADKAKIQAAPGFAATAWPSPNDPEVNRFWSDLKSTGAPAGVERSYRRSDLDLKSDKPSIKSEVNVDTDRKSKIYTDADKEKKVKIEVDKD